SSTALMSSGSSFFSFGLSSDRAWPVPRRSEPAPNTAGAARKRLRVPSMPRPPKVDGGMDERPGGRPGGRAYLIGTGDSGHARAPAARPDRERRRARKREQERTAFGRRVVGHLLRVGCDAQQTKRLLVPLAVEELREELLEHRTGRRDAREK